MTERDAYAIVTETGRDWGSEEEVTMEPAVDAPVVARQRLTDEQQLVHAWRAERLWRLGLPGWRAEMFADIVAWHSVADLTARGCPPALAVEILL